MRKVVLVIPLSKGALGLVSNHSIYTKMAKQGHPWAASSVRITNHFSRHLALSSIPDD